MATQKAAPKAEGPSRLTKSPEKRRKKSVYVFFCIGASICIGRESWCLPYAGFFLKMLANKCFYWLSPKSVCTSQFRICYCLIWKDMGIISEIFHMLINNWCFTPDSYKKGFKETLFCPMSSRLEMEIEKQFGLNKKPSLATKVLSRVIIVIIIFVISSTQCNVGH